MLTDTTEVKNGVLRAQTELASVQCEQEDLLLLLAEQDARLQRYSSHLAVRGVTPPPGEELDDEDDSGPEEGSLQ